MLGIAGAHRAGKTTLARAVSAELHIPFIKTTAARQAHAEMNLRPEDDLSIDDRIRVQNRALDLLVDDLAKAGTTFISDRTPLDMAAYMLVDCMKATGTPEQQADIVAYVKRCINVTNRFYNYLWIIPPGIPYVVEKGKPPPNPAFQEHHHFVVQGLAAAPEVTIGVTCMPRWRRDLGERVEQVCDDFEETMELFAKSVAGQTAH